MHDFRLHYGCSVMVAMCFCVIGLRCRTLQKHNFKGKPIRWVSVKWRTTWNLHRNQYYDVRFFVSADYYQLGVEFHVHWRRAFFGEFQGTFLEVASGDELLWFFEGGWPLDKDSRHNQWGGAATWCAAYGGLIAWYHVANVVVDRRGGHGWCRLMSSVALVLRAKVCDK
jgi:hypothetical protein